MKAITTALLGAGLLALTACGGQGDDTAGDNAAANAEAVAENFEEQADNTTNEVQADALEDKADAVEDAGQAKEEAIDEADVKANQQ